MRLIVATVNYCCANSIIECLSTTASQVRDCRGQWWIVDNHSLDDSVDVLRSALTKFPDVHLLEAPRNGGFGYGNNLVIEKAISGPLKADYIYFLNPDACPQPGAIAAMMSYLDDHPDVGIVGSGLVDEADAYTASMFRFPTFWSELDSALAFGPVSRLLKSYLQTLPPLQSPGPVDWVAGTSFMVRTEALRTTGGFDEDFFLYWEEVELCSRIAKAGFQIHGLPEAKVRHIGGVSTGMHRDERRIPGYWHQSRNMYFAKTGTGGPLSILNLATSLALVMRRLLEFVRRKPMAHPHFTRDHIKYALQFYLQRN